MLYELSDTKKAAALFDGWEETLILSCLQGVMGRIYVSDPETPESALAYIGCFGFLAGKPDAELILGRPAGFSILTPQNESWAELIEKCVPSAKKVTRYAIKKDTRFDAEKLRQLLAALPAGYELRDIDTELYDKCLKRHETEDFVSSFESKEAYLRLGRGKVILKNGEIVSGASSYARYNGGIEIEVDTVPEERRKQLATAVCAALILSCLEEGLYPSWDAQNIHSVRLAEKLGYEFDREYTAYEVE